MRHVCDECAEGHRKLHAELARAEAAVCPVNLWNGKRAWLVTRHEEIRMKPMLVASALALALSLAGCKKTEQTAQSAAQKAEASTNPSGSYRTTDPAATIRVSRGVGHA